jgi:hypothetical protein
MSHDGLAFLSLLHATDRFEKKSHAHVLGACAAQSELAGKVAAECASDEEESLAILNRWLELAMCAGELGWLPRRELIRLEAARELDRMSPGAAELALQLALAEGRHRAKGAQAEQVQTFELFLIEWKLMR